MFKKIILFTIAFTVSITIVSAQSFVIKWQKTIGGNGDDIVTSVVKTTDKGFIVSGYSNSDISGDKQQNSYSGSNDFWIIKLDLNGVIQWSKTYGGANEDNKPVIIQTSDGGYLTGGTSISTSSDVKAENRIDSSYDFWLLKLDASGNIQWENTIGGSFCEYLTGLVETADSYLAAGLAYSNTDHDKSQDNIGAECWGDYWLVKLTKVGSIKWNKSYGGTNQDALTSLQLLRDKTYLMGGYSYAHANGTKTKDLFGNCDYYIVRTDTSGKQLWDRDFGGKFSDYMTASKQASDGNYILGGYSNSPASGSKTQGIRGMMDYWTLKVSPGGAVVWDRTFGGNKFDYLTSVQQTVDKGFLFGGYSNSDSGFDKSSPSKGDFDYWVVKVDSSGNKIFDKSFGGSGTDKLAVALEVAKSQFLFAGTSNSPISGDKTSGTVGGTGKNDFWIVRANLVNSKKAVTNSITNTVANSSVIKLPDANNSLQLHMQAFPNPAKKNLTVSYANAKDKKASISIFSTDGKVLYQSALQSSNGTMQINIAAYTSGTYFLVLKNGSSSITRLIVKE